MQYMKKDNLQKTAIIGLVGKVMNGLSVLGDTSDVVMSGRKAAQTAGKTGSMMATSAKSKNIANGLSSLNAKRVSPLQTSSLSQRDRSYLSSQNKI